MMSFAHLGRTVRMLTRAGVLLRATEYGIILRAIFVQSRKRKRAEGRDVLCLAHVGVISTCAGNQFRRLSAQCVRPHLGMAGCDWGIAPLAVAKNP